MFLMRADPLRKQEGGGWALEIESFLSPGKWHRAERRVPFGAQTTRDFQGPTGSPVRELLLGIRTGETVSNLQVSLPPGIGFNSRPSALKVPSHQIRLA
jgi:hypothetical protein